MIEIKRSQVLLDNIAAEHLLYYLTKTTKKIDEFLKKRLPKEQRAFLQYIRINLKKILIGRPEELEKIANEIEVHFPTVVAQIRHSKSKAYSLLGKIQTLFNYDAFTKRNAPSKWGAYRLATLLNVNVCVYCNRQYTHTYSSPEKRVRPQFDHFLDKASHPYMAISLYNLIPCCSICNSSLKGTEKFTTKTHLHPYIEGVGERIRFSVRFKTDSLDYMKLWDGNSDVFDIVFKTSRKTPLNFQKRFIRTIRTFKIKELYQFHKDYTAELIVKSQVYNDARIGSLLVDFPQLFQNRDDVLRMITTNYTKVEDLDKRVLAKLTIDIASEFELT